MFVPGKTATGKTCKNCLKMGRLCPSHEKQSVTTLKAKDLPADAAGRKSGHMVLFRLPADIKVALYEAIEAEGYTSKNDWFREQVRLYLEERGVRYVESEE